jgi:hypothetical protein
MPTATYIVEWKPAGSWVDISAHIEAVDGDWNLSGNKDNALSFGDASELRCTVKTVNLTLQATAYLDVPIRVTFAMDAATGYAFWGVIAKRDRDQESLTFECEGYARLIRRTRVYTESRFRRPVATATTAASVEDPADGSYVAGLINETLWEAGGRPLEQDFSYPTALFYYSVPETAILAPEWSWLAGEDAWGECLRLAQAAGGQIFQDADGVVQYLQPLSFGEGSSAATFDEDVYGDLTEQGSGELVVTKVVCPYIPRVAQALQEVINDTTPRLVNAGETVAIVLEAQNPLKSILTTGGGLPDGAIKATFLDGRVVAATDFTQAAVLHGQRVTLTVENTSAYPFAIDALVIQGEPIVAGEAGVVTVGSGDVALTVQDNPYVQSQAHAERLATMILAFHGSTLPLRSATDLVYDPDRSVGETIELTCSRWSLSAVPHLIVSKQHSETGIVAGYDLVPVAGLPKSSDFFIVGATSYTGQTKKLGF